MEGDDDFPDVTDPRDPELPDDDATEAPPATTITEF